MEHPSSAMFNSNPLNKCHTRRGNLSLETQRQGARETAQVAGDRVKVNAGILEVDQKGSTLRWICLSKYQSCLSGTPTVQRIKREGAGVGEPGTLQR